MSEAVSESKPSFLDKFAEISGRIGSEVHLRSLRDAFATIMPLYILAGIAVLINNVVFPLFLQDQALLNAQYWGNALTLGTLNISAILLAGVVGYCHAHNMRYVIFRGIKWKIKDFEINRPRVIISMGEEYHGDEA